MLVRLDVRHLSIREVALADILILAAGTDPLPDHITAWVTTSLQECGHGPPVLIALHPEVSPPPTPLCAFLRHTADLWHADFLCNEDLLLRMEQGWVPQLLQRRHHQDIEADPDEAGHPEFAGYRWGIND